MQAMCLNCTYYEEVLNPWCNKHNNATHPAMKCHEWLSNQQPTPGEEEEHVERAN